MKIVDVRTETFVYKSYVVRESHGHVHPGPVHDAKQTLLRIMTDEGIEGHAFGANPEIIKSIVKPLLLGQDPFSRERLWQELMHRQRLQ